MTKLLQKENLQNLNSITHEGKVVIVATDSAGKIWYTVKQDGFEDSYLNTPPEQRTGWENWRTLELPNQPIADQSVIEKEAVELTYQADSNKFVLRSRYKTFNESTATPVQLVSAFGHIYVFRQSKTNTLLVDRFVLDGMTNKLNPKLEVRFKRSRQKHKPTKNMTKGVNGLANVDSLDFRDADGDFFYEPTTELCLVNHLQSGWFSVVLVPTIENDVYRWHIFAYNSQTQKVELTTLRASDEGLFDVKDYTIFDAVNETLVPRSIPGVIKRTIDINGVVVTNGLAATIYDLQQEQETQVGKQLLKTATRLMLAIPTSQGTATFSFAIAGDGTLAQIDETPENTIIRSEQKEVLLPLNTLEEIKALGDRSPVPQGNITALALGKNEEDVEDLIKITAENAAELERGDRVKITGTKDYQGLYQTKRIDDHTFEIALSNGNGMGFWEREDEEEGGLVFDGMITGYRRTPEGKLQVTCQDHGLEDGEEVQLTGTDVCNDTFFVTQVDETGFAIDRKWASGEAINIQRVAQKRQGIVFDGDGDYIALGEMNPNFSQGITIEAWVWYDQLNPWSRIVDFGNGAGIDNILLANEPGSNNLNLTILQGQAGQALTAVGVLETGKWMHLAATIDASGTAKLFKNGQLVQSGQVHLPRSITRTRNYIAKSNWADAYFQGKISDLRIWQQARTEADIRNSMYLQLTGKEVGLVGYWRLGGISERKVVDFSVNCNEGTVYGDAYVSAVTLKRKLASGMDAVKYSNPELFAVSERATYSESFEFKINAKTPIALDYLDNADGKGNKIFTLAYWGKTSRSADAKTAITVVQDKFEDLGKGWYRVSCNFTVPEGISLLRSFEIANVKGNWDAIEIRKHRIRLLSDTITEAKYSDGVALKLLADGQVDLATQLHQLNQKEQEETSLLLEKKKLEQQLNALANLSQTEAQINQLRVEIPQLERDQKLPQAELDNTFNYWCTITSVAGGLLPLGTNGNIHSYGCHWCITKTADNLYRLENRENQLALTRVDPGIAQAVFNWQTLESLPWPFKPCSEWRLERVGQSYRIENGFSGSSLLHGTVLIWCIHPYMGGAEQQWNITSTGQVANQAAIDSAKSSLDAILTILKAKREELQRLEEVFREGRTKESLWRKRLSEVIAQLTKVQTEINTLNTHFIEAVKQRQSTSQVMPQISKDRRGLATQAALLSFMNPASRLNALATCEGNVQLSYFDTQGQMRQTLYDATADSQNAAFEQWIPDALRTCLNLSNSTSVVKLNNPLYLPTGWTIEAWFVYPLPEATGWNTLTKGFNAGGHQIVVKDGKQLGTFPEGKEFYDSGFNLELLSPGWHHIAAVGQGDTTLFYIDGKQVGDVKAKLVADAQAALNQAPNDAAAKQKLEQLKKAVFKDNSSVQAIGNVNYSGGGQPFGKVAEVRIWGVALKDEEIAINSKTLLSGNEPGLLAYYPMSEATGTEVRDRTGQGRNAQVHGGSWWACAAPIGNPGTAVVQFDGVNDQITVADALNLQITAYTVELWLKSDGIPNEEWKGIIGKPGRSFHMWLNASGYIHHRFHTSASIDAGAPNTPNGSISWNQWQHVAITNDGTTAKTYINGKLMAEGSTGGSLLVDKQPLYMGCNLDSGRANYFKGQLAEVRIWKTARSQAEIQSNMSKRLTGQEPQLAAYYPLNEIKLNGNTRQVLDLASSNHGTVIEAIAVDSNTLPLANDSLVCSEYSNVTVAPDGKKLAIMRRFFAYPALTGASVLSDQRIESLELKWIGNAQFAPTLLGYIEGAPPVPSENLTIEEDYNGATSVELTMSEDVEFSWNRSQDAGLGANAEVFIGGDTEMEAGLGFVTKIGAMRAGFKGNFEFNYQFQNESNITSSSSLSMTDKLELRGTPEETPRFPYLGNRFIPKNIGYALVISALADVFITRLARSGKMVGYQVQPVDGIPPDVNTITFLMNPAYTMNGSLDGLTGSCATSDRFFKHVPEMRAQYGSLYPASYYRLREAYSLKQAIEAEDKRRESYFANFDVRLVDETSLDRNIGSGEVPATIGLQREEDKPDTHMTEEEKKKAEAEKVNSAKTEAADAVDKQSAATKQKQAEIQNKIDDQEKRTQATNSFAGWQKRMEDLQIRAGKRNIVNTYVWDADGGLRTEAQSFASTVEHTIGGSFAMNAGLGAEGKFAAGAAVELTAQATVNLTQTMSKTEARSKGFELNVDVSGLEFKGITDYKDNPILPGEKVDRYRFMSFYLEASTQNFQDFFNYVVDPEWLASNDEEARALRQTQAGKPNKTWRVLHRVTYVERPALMGFGRDLRKLRSLPESSDQQQLLDRIALLEASNQNLEKKLDQILKQLSTSSSAG